MKEYKNAAVLINPNLRRNVSLHNPAGYYLPLPEQIESEIKDLSFEELVEVVNDLTFVMTGEVNFLTASLSPDTDLYIDRLPIVQQTALLRWMAERLAWFQLPSTIRAKKTWT